MLFHTWTFAIFFGIVLAAYVRLGHRGQNRLLLAASYLFYGWWDVRFLGLLLFTTVLDFGCALAIARTPHPAARRRWLVLSLVGSLGTLAVFKYAGFFVESASLVVRQLGLSWHPATLRIILPVGISFYTFQTMSYVIDVYRRRVQPTRRFVDFALYVAFFPQLVAGPIERADRLLPQIQSPRRIRIADLEEGTHLFLWGLFEKVVVADSLAPIVESVFGGPPPYAGPTVLVALYAFAVQIFCDFDGYSNMARGVARVMGFTLMVNFQLPYFAANPREFWQRWHISLSTWLRDYLYIPLGGNRRGTWLTYRNLLVTMLLGGLWHGAAWTFVVWGLYHGLLLAGHRRVKELGWGARREPSGGDRWLALRIVACFHAVCLGWLFFRAGSWSQVMAMAHGLIVGPWTSSAVSVTVSLWLRLLVVVIPLLVAQTWQYWRDDLLALRRLAFPARWAVYTAMFHLVVLCGASGATEFIYFQF